jgi:hypothetical protein
MFRIFFQSYGSDERILSRGAVRLWVWMGDGGWGCGVWGVRLWRRVFASSSCDSSDTNGARHGTEGAGAGLRETIGKDEGLMRERPIVDVGT